MTLKSYLNFMTILTAICWLGWLAVIFLINPAQTGFLGFILFYSSLFLALVGSCALVGFLVRSHLKEQPIFLQAQIAFRQGTWISLFAVGILALRGLDILRWWNALFLLLFLVILESFFLSSRRKYKKI